jgi:hypothetical protein
MGGLSTDLRARLLSAAAVAVIAWLVVWPNTTPRTSWDSLMYHRFALEYAGASSDEATSGALTIFERYASDRDVQMTRDGMRAGGSPWDAMQDPVREPWVDLYRSRPLYAVLVAAGYPVLGLRAPLLVSAGAVLVFTVALLVGLGAIVGYGAALVAALIGFANPHFARWLVFLQPDGLSLALWTAGLVAAAGLVHFGGRRWLAGLVVAAMALSFTRPLGVFLPVAVGIPFVIALAVRSGAWRRLGLATLATAIPVAIFAAYSHLLGLPGAGDVLQDLPSRHWLRPEVADPVRWTWDVATTQIKEPLVPTLLGDPTLWVPLVVGVVGLLVVGRSWALAPMVAAVAVVPLAYLIHPQLSEAPRTMAPIWLSLQVGMALLAARAITKLDAIGRSV